MSEGDVTKAENGKMETLTGNRDRGVAAIKPKYLTTKEEFHSFIDDGDTAKKDGLQKCEKLTAHNETSPDSTEPEAKRIKLADDSCGNDKESQKNTDARQEKKRARGQNKSRPHMKPSHFGEIKLCSSIKQGQGNSCTFGEKCRFSHDLSKFMAEKPDDIGPNCYLFETLGKCNYGAACRFAKSHLGKDFENLINEEVVKKCEGNVLVKNNLNRDLQLQLRKKKVKFEKTDQYLTNMNKTSKPGASGKGNALKPVVEECGVTSECTDTEVGTDQQDTLLSTAAIKEDSTPQIADCAKKETSTIGALTDEDIIKLRPCEKKTIDFRNKLYLAPLTTCGNLPFRRICKRYGADITCGEMAVCTNILQGQPSEWALLRRHHSEDLFGVQLEGAFPDTMTRCAELINRTIEVDFVDINVGCPIDLVYSKGGGCGLMNRTNKFEQIVKGMKSVLDVPLTVKIRTGVHENHNIAHKLIPNLKEWGVSMITLHGRSREQRYTKLADWDYIDQCAKIANPIPLFGNGDILSYEDSNRALQTGVSGIMLARGALVKPWIFTEIKEQRHWDISSTERFDILRNFTNYGLENWGSDSQGVEKTRRFLLEWLSFLCRYIPVGLLEHVPQKINERPPYYLGRDYMETLMASQNASDWIKISEMLLGPVPQMFTFLPKHKANSYK
ncbi:tRNA-dihydrouridine(47) synthase [NAD(P)(+)]-like [Pelobates cultripes]|uniref:tRNA-dihydrouridine(47) synthase [NAD(P)(+)] n=3 Tax=Pelobates cultripes TaxID=61616 RepID=A0AAD1VZH8_PELCU|nr:tRNA-dihydrouridine(47) synthase [NAD(P)(+)]-like [Pelobates cultripes]